MGETLPDPPASDPDESRRRATESEMSVTSGLVREFQGGRKEALNELFERYYERVLRVVRIRMSAFLKSRVEPEDVVQETLAAAFQHFDRFELRDSARLIDYLAKIAENQIRGVADKVFAKKRDPALEVALDDVRSHFQSKGGFPEPSARITNPADRAARREEAEALDRAVGELDGGHRDVIVLRDFEGGAWTWVAEQLGKSPAAAQMQYHRAKIKLARILGGAAPA